MKYFLVLLCLLHLTASLTFKEEWHEYIAGLIQSHIRKPMSPVIIIPQFPVHHVDTDVSVARFYLPEVIIWDPLCQFPALFINKIPPICTERYCRLPMKHVVWQDGSSRRYYPRCIYGTRGCVVLVCQIFRCARGHFMTSCDPRILQHFERKQVIPFILLHKSGVTRELQLQIFRLCSQGRSFCDIHKFLLWSVQDNNAQRMMYEHHTCTSPPQQTEHEARQVMSSDLITNVFIITFREFQQYMYQEMYDLTSEYISCDHTFKLASHIGILENGFLSMIHFLSYKMREDRFYFGN